MTISTSDLHIQAEKLLADKKILKTLTFLGKVESCGSFKHNLMVWPDIDLKVYTNKLDLTAIGKIVKDFISDKDLYKLKCTDYTVETRERGFPEGYYLGLSYLIGKVRWKIDVWLVQKGHGSPEETENIISSLNDAQRETVLKLKAELLKLNRYPGKKTRPNSVVSADIYKAVSEGVTTVAELDIWLRKLN